MDSDEDMQYVSEGDDFYGAESDEEDEEYGFDDEEDTSMEEPSRLPQLNYFVMNEEEIRQRQEEAIRSVCGVLSVPRPDAILLLRHFKWCVSTVNEEWFNNEQRIRKSVGLVDRSASLARRQLPREMRCGICLDVCPAKEMIAAACGHYFCDTCWRGYIHSAIGDGPGCLTLRCPDLNCGAAIGEDMVFKLASKVDREKYKRYLLRSFVEDNRQAKWCPAPGCEFAVEFYPGGSSHEIVCKCARNFCWRCLEEAHRPVGCETVAKWIMKNSAESENMNWILANSKPCPKCKRPIEKNQGCMHMTCTPPCKFEFCWLCLGPWDQHGERTGGFYACNRYETAKQEGLYDEADRRREMAKNMLERYTHYYERWATNESSRAKAVQDYQQMQLVHLEKLSDRQCQPASQLKFVSEAWLQIVECRRILKWTYAYGYYLPEQEMAKRQFFEYLQGEAEHGLERLHICAEKELQMFLEDETQPTMSFNEFRTKLAGLTSVTRTYFENLVRALENGLCDVEASKAAAASTKASASSKQSGSSKTKSKKAGSSRFSNSNATNNTNTNTNSGSGVRSWDESEHWSCTLCTYANVLSARVCDMCHNPRAAA